MWTGGLGAQSYQRAAHGHAGHTVAKDGTVARISPSPANDGIFANDRFCLFFATENVISSCASCIPVNTLRKILKKRPRLNRNLQSEGCFHGSPIQPTAEESPSKGEPAEGEHRLQESMARWPGGRDSPHHTSPPLCIAEWHPLGRRTWSRKFAWEGQSGFSSLRTFSNFSRLGLPMISVRRGSEGTEPLPPKKHVEP